MITKLRQQFEQNYTYEVNRDTDKIYKKAMRYMFDLRVMNFNGNNCFFNKIENSWKNFFNVEELTGFIQQEDLSLTNGEIGKILKKVSGILGSGILKVELQQNERVFYFKNGYVNLNFEEEDKEYFTKIKPGTYEEFPIDFINYNYKTKIVESNTTSLMKQLMDWFAKGDKKELKTIYTMIGICANNIRVESFFNLYGVQGSGKSTLLDLITQIVGKRFSTSSSLNSLNERFGLLPLIGKKLLFNGDASKSTIDEGMLKNLTTIGLEYTIELKGVNTMLHIPLPLNIVINSNHKLQFKSMDGIDRRYVLIHFPYDKNYKGDFEPLTIEEFKQVKRIINNKYDFIDEAMEYIIPLMLRETKMFLDGNKKWDFSNIAKISYNDLLLTNNNVLQFLEEYDLLKVLNEKAERNSMWKESLKYVYCKGEDLYLEYKNMIITNGGKPKGKNSFLTTISEELNKIGIVAKSNVNISEIGKRFAILKNEKVMKGQR